MTWSRLLNAVLAVGCAATALFWGSLAFSWFNDQAMRTAYWPIVAAMLCALYAAALAVRCLSDARR